MERSAAPASNDPEACVTPGQRLGHEEDFIAGPGTYIHDHHIYASLVGFAKRVAAETVPVDQQQPKQPQNAVDSAAAPSLPVLIVSRDKDPIVVPDKGNVVACQVTRINPRFATVRILCVGSKALKETYTGVIRVQDVRATEIDKVEIAKCFRPGDIVTAEVISLGDAKSYFLSTAKNEYGVIFARSVANATMIPISWNQMQCPKTKTKEFRKVAKVL